MCLYGSVQKRACPRYIKYGILDIRNRQKTQNFYHPWQYGYIDTLTCLFLIIIYKELNDELAGVVSFAQLCPGCL